MKRLYSTFALVLLAFGLAGLVFWRYFYLASVAIDPIPSDAKITINGRGVVERTFHLPKGNYVIDVSAPGYRHQVLKLTLGLGTEVNKRIELIALPRPQKLLGGPLRSLRASVDRKTLFFERDGTLFSYGLGLPAASAAPISPALTDLDTVNWSPDFALALLHKTSGEVGLYDFHRYDLLHQEYRPLDAGVQETAWAGDGQAFYADYQVPATGEHSLVKLNRAGSGLTRLIDLAGIKFPLRAPTLQSGPANLLLLAGQDPAKASNIFSFDTFQKLPPLPITDSGQADVPVLSPDRNHLAYTDNGQLVIAETSGKNKRNVELRPRAGNYAFVDNGTLAILLPNQVSFVSLADGTHRDYEIYAPSDAAVAFVLAEPDGKTLDYVFQGSLYQIKAKE